MIYPLRLIKNSIIYTKKYGFKPAISKSNSVVKGWLIHEGRVKDISKSEYQNWIKSHEASTENYVGDYKPLVSILMPVYNVDGIYLEAAVESIRAQTYENWELCIVDDASTAAHIRPLIQKLIESDSRIRAKFSETNNHISVTTNVAFDMSLGEFVLLMDNDDIIPSNCLSEIVSVLNEHRDLDLVYFDEDKLSHEGRIEPFFKPAPSPEMLLNTMYPTHALYSRSIFTTAGRLRKGYEGSQDYDLCLRVFNITDKIHHIPKVLYHWRKIAGSTSDSVSYKPYVINSAKSAIEEAISAMGYRSEVEGENYPFRTRIEIKYSPSVEIIIPSRNKCELLERCISSITKLSSYTNYSVTVVDNQSDEARTLRYLEQIKKQGINVLRYDQSFNFSAINNMAASRSRSDYLLFLNNDTEVLESSWIEEMLMWAQLKDVAAVGAKLLFPDLTVQHAGVIMGLGPDLLDNARPVAGHAFYKENEGSTRAFNQMNMVKNYLAVTAACLMIKREKFNQVGGFNEKDLKVAYNDVDICLRLFEAGYRNVYTPHARLLHYESASRVKEPAHSETEYMRQKWGRYIETDPYYNPNLEKNSIYSYILKRAHSEQ